jgi:outer membrane protein OmpA-like peptidoglycan-associated protein
VYQISAGNWSKPINAGPMINTPDNEECPFVHFDGRTMYFMRDGKKGLGGYDLYMARKALDGQWQEPQNLGAPINSGTDEGALSIHPNGSTAVITRYTAEGKNDLFEFELPQSYQSAPLQALHVTIRDQETKLPVRARLEIFETNQLDTVRLSQWADEEGKISVTLQRNKRYGIIATADQYLMFSSGIEASGLGSRSLEIMMTAIKSASESVTVLRNVFFESGSAELLKISETELNKLMWTMNKNESMKIEIRGHTDHVGDDQANQILSEARAKSVFQYLISKGIDATRMSYKGFGESQPLADNETEEGRQLNRRTEFKILLK